MGIIIGGSVYQPLDAYTAKSREEDLGLARALGGDADQGHVHDLVVQFWGSPRRSA
jgi:hypothetical protein